MYLNYGFDEVIQEKMWSRESIKKYTNILNELCINPILLPNCYKEEGQAVDKLEGLMSMARRIAKEKYFI